jgi:hypothetical protein
MIERRNGPRFLREACGIVLRQALDGDRTLEAPVMRTPYFTHAARAKR